MTNHSKSLFFSLFIHLLLFGGIILLYSEYLPKKIAFKEKRICINLQSIKKESTKTVQKKVCQPVKKEKKRVHKKIIHKKVHKKAPKRVKKKQEIKKKKIVHVAEIKKKPEIKPVVQEVQKKEEETLNAQTQPLPSSVRKKMPTTQEYKSVNKEKVYIQNNLNEIVLLIKENLYYPRRARKRGIEGTIVVKFFLHKDGSVSHTQVLSSKSDILSRAAMKTINNLSGKFPKPSEELTLSVPIHYQLN